MEQEEEEMRRKEEENQRDLEQTIGLVDFLSLRDFSLRGRNVRPSGKQTKDLESLASSLRIRDASRRKTTGDVPSSQSYESQKLSDFDILGSPRIHIVSGPVNKREPGYFICQRKSLQLS